MAIAQVIHQLWSGTDPPDRYRAFRETWERLHPDWEMRLWTEADISALVAADYPQLSALYGLGEARRRFDLGRGRIPHGSGGFDAGPATGRRRRPTPRSGGPGSAWGARGAPSINGS